MSRRSTLVSVCWCCSVIACCCASSSIDLASSSNAAAWLQHSVVGGPSWDAFERDAANPVYVGQPNRPWVVNGFLYSLSRLNASRQCILAGEYPHGYFDPAHPAQMRALYSADSGLTWSPGPVVVAGDATSYDHGGHTPDGSAVVDEDGVTTRVVFDWATPTNADGGLGYAQGPAGGPYVRAAAAVVAESATPPLPLLPQYRRVYGGTLLRRGASDWLILAAMSTKHNGGGSWAMCCLTASSPQGPWSPPTLLLTPQDAGWHAHPTEFYPAFEGAGDGFVYAPATSISLNREYQLVWRAALADAHEPTAWSVVHDGSAWHWDGAAGGAIWGQTFSGFVDRGGGGAALRVMFPALNAASVGTLNTASAPWASPPDGSPGGAIAQRATGFFVSAPRAPSLALTSGAHAPAFAVDVAASGARSASPRWSLLWNAGAPVGADTWPFPGGAHALTLCNATALELSTSGFRLLQLPPGEQCAARAAVLAAGPACALPLSSQPQPQPPPLHVRVTQTVAGAVSVECDGALVANATVRGAPLGGRLGVLAAPGTAVNVSALAVAYGWVGAAAPPLALLATDAMCGAGNLAPGWRADATPGLWRFDSGGLVCVPAGVPGVDNVTVSVDGGDETCVDTRAASPVPSAVVWTSPQLAPGRHALTVRAAPGGALAVDSVDVDCGGA